MPGYLAVKALPIFPTNVVSKCAVYHVTSPSAFAFAARSANSSSARAGACAAMIANEDNTDIAQVNFMSALHRVGVGPALGSGLRQEFFLGGERARKSNRLDNHSLMFGTADLIDLVARHDRPNRASFLNLDALDFDRDPDRLGGWCKMLKIDADPDARLAGVEMRFEGEDASMLHQCDEPRGCEYTRHRGDRRAIGEKRRHELVAVHLSLQAVGNAGRQRRFHGTASLTLTCGCASPASAH